MDVAVQDVSQLDIAQRRARVKKQRRRRGGSRSATERQHGRQSDLQKAERSLPQKAARVAVDAQERVQDGAPAAPAEPAARQLPQSCGGERPVVGVEHAQDGPPLQGDPEHQQPQTHVIGPHRRRVEVEEPWNAAAHHLQVELY